MTALGPVLARLGMSQYLDRFAAEGFDTWETLLDITESDLRELEVKLGHRRKLQREIAIARGVGTEQVLTTPTSQLVSAHGCPGEGGNAVDSKGDEARAVGAGGKRKYRRHPKVDENAPERAPSAYVIFSNRVREDLKPQNLSFTEIAKRVGEQWQLLAPEIKGQYESQAANAKEKYRAELDEYKKTDHYREYNDYLLEFRQKNASLEDKRPRLEKQPSVASSRSHSDAERIDLVDLKPAPTTTRGRRADSFSSINTYSATTSEQASPTATNTPKNLSSVFTNTPQFSSSTPNTSATTAFRTRNEPNNFASVFSNVDRPPLTPVGLQERSTFLGRSEPRTTPTSLTGMLQDSDMLRSRSSPLSNLQREQSHSSTSSPVSSVLSSKTCPLPGPPSSRTSLTGVVSSNSPADALSSRRLPPISTFPQPPSDTTFQPATQSKGYPSLRPDFQGSTLPPHVATATAPVSAPASHCQSPYESRQAQPGLKGDSQASPKPEQRASFKGEYDNEAFTTPLGANADPLSVLAYAGRIVDKEEGRSRRTRGDQRRGRGN